MIELNITARRVTRLLLIGLGILLAFQFIINIGHLMMHRRMDAFTELFDMDREANMPVFYNCLLFFVAAVLFFLHGRAREAKERRAWNVMALVFLFLGIDEGSQIHEKFMLITLRMMHYGEQGTGDLGWLYYAWIIPYGVACLALVVVLLPWLLRLKTRLRNGLMISGAVFVLGAVVLEAMSGKVAEPLDHVSAEARQIDWLPCEVYPVDQCQLYADPGYVWLYTAEEATEMLGLILCIWVLLDALEEAEVGFSVRMSKA